MSYLPGKAVWFELATPDKADAQSFYGEVLGWKTDTVPMPGGEYTMFKPGADAKHNSGLVEPRGPQAFWGAYVSVDDVDAVVAYASKNGGAVHMDAMTVPGVGRMAAVADPEGAALMPFRGEQGDRSDEEDGVGDFCWIELMADDPEAASKWFAGAFGYDKTETMPMDNGPYTVLSRNGKGRAGVMGKPAPMPSYWLPYVLVDDVDEVAARAKANGGQVPMAPFDAKGVGRIGLIIDRQGAALGLIKFAAPENG